LLKDIDEACGNGQKVRLLFGKCNGIRYIAFAAGFQYELRYSDIFSAPDEKELFSGETGWC